VSQRYRAPDPGRIEQTAILRDVLLPEVHFRRDEGASASLTRYSWLVVLNQDCDLQFDRLARAGQPLRPGGPPVNKDKLLRSVVLCPAFPQDHVLAGTYVEDATEWRGTQKDILLQNRHERYHVLPAEGPVTEPLVLDFKLITAVHPEYLQQWIEQHPASVVAVLCPPYRDRLIQRFVNYFGRIAEPEEV
jgi:hypothetical protein